MAIQSILQAWKGMLDGDSFIKAGWVHNLRLYQFSSADDLRFVVMGKVNVILYHKVKWMNVLLFM